MSRSLLAAHDMSPREVVRNIEAHRVARGGARPRVEAPRGVIAAWWVHDDRAKQRPASCVPRRTVRGRSRSRRVQRGLDALADAIARRRGPLLDALAADRRVLVFGTAYRRQAQHVAAGSRALRARAPGPAGDRAPRLIDRLTAVGND